MGVPRLFPWILDNFPNSYEYFQQGEKITIVDNLYIDGNALIHNSTQFVFSYGPRASLLDQFSEYTFKEKQLKSFEMFFSEVMNIARMIVPTKRLYIAIDGPAPIAKQAQQRRRRFTSSSSTEGENNEVEKFDSTAITPGTPYMFELTKYMNYAIRKVLNERNILRDGVVVYFSPPNVPGEGEHKIMEFIREEYSNVSKESNCFVSPDGDLIMLTLATHIKKMYLFREDVKVYNHYYLVDIGSIGGGLPRLLGRRGSIVDTENDFIFIGFFVGNDFLPMVDMFMFLEDGLNMMNNIYSYTSKKYATPLTYYDGSRSYVNMDGFREFIGEVSKYEEEFLLNHINYPVKEEKFRNNTLWKHISEIVSNNRTLFRLDYKGYRKDYYNKCGIHDEDGIREICYYYVRTLIWVYEYYINGLPSWDWYYPYYYAPLMKDLYKFLIGNKINMFFEREELGKPTLPFIQILSIVPKKGAKYLPLPLRKLMLDDDTPLKEYYPTSIEIDCEGKTADHMCIVKLPFIDKNVVTREYNKIHMKYTYVRNSIGTVSKFTLSKNKKSTYISDYGTIDTNKVIKETL